MANVDADKGLDEIDVRILRALQTDASLPIAEIAARVGLSQSPCWKRIQRLETSGIISRRVALVPPERVGLTLTVFVAVVIKDHTTEARDVFSVVLEGMPEVLEAYRMAGDIDFLLHVVVADLTAYDEFYQRLIKNADLQSVTSRFVLQRSKFTSVLPISPRER